MLYKNVQDCALVVSFIENSVDNMLPFKRFIIANAYCIKFYMKYVSKEKFKISVTES